MTAEIKVIHRLRLSLADAHYAGGLVDGARVLRCFGDGATELLAHFDGMEGLFRAYRNVEFLAPVYAGDFLEIEVRLTGVGRRSRQMSFEARKFLAADRDSPDSGKVFVLDPPQVVCRAEGTCVVVHPKPS